MVDKARIEFERWGPGASICNNLRVCFWNSNQLRFRVVRDLQAKKTKELLLSEYIDGVMVLVVEDVKTKHQYVVKLIYTQIGKTELNYHLRLSRLANGRLPNVIQILKHSKLLSFDTSTVLDILLMEKGETFTRQLNYLHLENDGNADECSLAVAFQMLFSVYFLHDNCFQHRDIRLQNFVFSKRDDIASQKMQYSLDDKTTFSIPIYFDGKLAIPLLIDFGLTTDMTLETDVDCLTGYCSMFRSPELMFLELSSTTKITNGDDLFALAIVWLAMTYKEFPLPKFTHAQKMDFEDALESATQQSLFDFYHQYTPRELWQQGVFLVLLMGFPPEHCKYFYDSVLGKQLLKVAPVLTADPNYDFLEKRKRDTAFPAVHALICEVMKWDKNQRPASAYQLLRSHCFDRFRAHQNNALPQWKLFY